MSTHTQKDSLRINYLSAGTGTSELPHTLL